MRAVRLAFQAARMLPNGISPERAPQGGAQPGQTDSPPLTDVVL